MIPEFRTRGKKGGMIKVEPWIEDFVICKSSYSRVLHQREERYKVEGITWLSIPSKVKFLASEFRRWKEKGKKEERRKEVQRNLLCYEFLTLEF